MPAAPPSRHSDDGVVVSGRIPLRGIAVILAIIALALAGCAKPPPRVLAATPTGNPLVPRLCADTTAVPGLGAPQLEAAYQAPAMFAHGITRTGTAIAVILPYTNPWVKSDLAIYSRRYRLPIPDVNVIDWRDAPAAHPDEPGQAGWAQEGALDLEMAHVLAPGARLIYLEVPAGNGSAYMPALNWLVTHQRITVVSFSEGIPETALQSAGGYGALSPLRGGLEAAARTGVTMVADTGDFGATQPEDQNEGNLYPFPATLWPASDPLVTAVGGTRLHLDATGHRTSADTVFASIKGWAGGGGLSSLFSRPAWQDSASAVVGSHRGVADVSMDASSCSPVWAYTTTNALPGQHPGWAEIFGTSVAAPLFAGIAADAAQVAGHRLGVLGPALYRMHGPADGMLDVTEGTTTTPAIAGYPALRGYDLPTGIGTVADAWKFASALARQDARDSSW
jgi:subtilase family serine protease